MKGANFRKSSTCSCGGKAHHPLDARPVVPAAVEQHHFAGCRQVRHVALEVHLRFLTLRRRRQRHHTEDARADPLGDAPDHAALAGGIAALEHHADLRPGVLDPFLQLDQLVLQLASALLEIFAAHRLSALLQLPRGRIGASAMPELPLALELQPQPALPQVSYPFCPSCPS